MSTSEDVESYTNHIPAYIKLLMIVQSLIIIYFIFWTLEEYTNNLYFQSYVNTFLQGSGFGVIAVSSVGIFSAIASGLYMKLRQTRMQLQHLGTEAQPEPETHESGNILAPHVEQHLINMIRKSAADDATSTSLPVLKRGQPSGQAR